MPHSILMMHHPSGSSRGQASEMHIEARELVRMRDYLSLLISDHTGQPYDRVRGSGFLRCCLCFCGIVFCAFYRVVVFAAAALLKAFVPPPPLHFFLALASIASSFHLNQTLYHSTKPTKQNHRTHQPKNNAKRSSASCRATSGWTPRRRSSTA
jgi:hypothetical protein